jgi:hypothetical protein
MPTGFSGSPSDIIFTRHALERMWERGFTREDVRQIIQLGKTHYTHEGKCLFTVEATPRGLFKQKEN